MTKGWYPGAVARPVAAPSNDPAITPRVAILHVDAGNASTLYGLFTRNQTNGSGIEAHFFVKKDGTVEQYRSIYRQADANYQANDFAVSIETQGYGAGEWNAAQLKAIKALLLWLHSEAGIPLVKCPKWDGAGVGYHVQFGSPGKWTPVAKSCPGPDRVKQFENVLVPWMKTAVQPVATPRIDAAIKATEAIHGSPPEKAEALAALKRLRARRKAA